MVATVLVVCAIAALLPQDRYIRFQSLRGTLHTRAEWVYDRIHNDPTPVDILIVGPSRAVAGIDARMLEDSLDGQSGTRLHVANFAYAEPGLNLPYLMVRETLETKHPRLILVGILEHQTHNGHAAFKDLADARDMLVAPVVSKDYFSNLAFLPMRQLRLAADTVLADVLGYRHSFDPARYPGPDIDVEAQFPVHQPKPSTGPELEKAAAAYTHDITHAYLPASMGDVEFMAERFYLDRIARLAAEHHAKVMFVYLPAYKAPAAPLDLDYYGKFGPVLLPPESIRNDPGDYFDLYHLNAIGKFQLTTWLAANLGQTVTAWRSDPEPSDLGKK